MAPDPDVEEAVTLASILPVGEGMRALQQWKAEYAAKSWIAFEGGIETLLARTIKRWPAGDEPGLIEIVNLSKAVLAEMAGVMGIPPEALPFREETSDAVRRNGDHPDPVSGRPVAGGADDQGDVATTS